MLSNTFDKEFYKLSIVLHYVRLGERVKWVPMKLILGAKTCESTRQSTQLFWIHVDQLRLADRCQSVFSIIVLDKTSSSPFLHLCSGGVVFHYIFPV